ncbi:MAG: hypothetical protein MI921_18335 [Cytophagales bacterium]|nr:hypothetical protein [Cytophagales bacterium]
MHYNFTIKSRELTLRCIMIFTAIYRVSGINSQALAQIFGQNGCYPTPLQIIKVKASPNELHKGFSVQVRQFSI